MFFMLGVTQGRKEITRKPHICFHCGSYGQFCVYVTYTQLILFFIPVFKWNVKYYIESSCCHAIYELKEEAGKQLMEDSDYEIRESDVKVVYTQNICPHCGHVVDQSDVYCSHCGQRLGD